MLLNKYVYSILKLKISLNNVKVYTVLFLACIEYQMKPLGEEGEGICERAQIKKCQPQQKLSKAHIQDILSLSIEESNFGRNSTDAMSRGERKGSLICKPYTPLNSEKLHDS